MNQAQIQEEWKQALSQEFDTPYFSKLTTFVRDAYMHRVVFPHPSCLFAAFERTPFSKVKVVILGQDPYHGPGQANGLCFSVQSGAAVPPSLRNILKEIKGDLGKKSIITKGDLRPWANQGVLLLNATLTVEAGLAGSHQGKGWEIFTDAVVRILNDQKEHLVFMLWGNYARKKGAFIDRSKHLVLEAAHPSPLSAHNGFFGCRHFSQTNEYLLRYGKKVIQW